MTSLSRRHFFASIGVAGGAFVLSCTNDNGAAPAGTGAATATTVSTPLGHVTVPLAPERVLAVDSRQDAEIVMALDLPLAGFTSQLVRPWVPLRGRPEALRSPVDLVEVIRLEPDLIVCTNIESPYWRAPGLDSIAPLLPVDPTAEWVENLRILADWLARSAIAEDVIARYEQRVTRVRDRHREVIGEPIAVVGIDSDDRLTDLGHLPTVPGSTARDLGLNIAHFAADAQSPVMAAAARSDLAAARRIVVASDNPDIDATNLREHDGFRDLPAVDEGRVVVSADLRYGSVYTATECATLYDEVLRL